MLTSPVLLPDRASIDRLMSAHPTTDEVKQTLALDYMLRIRALTPHTTYGDELRLQLSQFDTSGSDFTIILPEQLTFKYRGQMIDSVEFLNGFYYLGVYIQDHPEEHGFQGGADEDEFRQQVEGSTLDLCANLNYWLFRCSDLSRDLSENKILFDYDNSFVRWPSDENVVGQLTVKDADMARRFKLKYAG